MKPTRRLAEHIEASTHLSDLAEKAAQLNAATETMRSVLPDELGRHATVARISTQEVVVITYSGAWATRLKMMEKLITGAFARAWGQLRNPRLRVHVDPPRAERRKARIAEMSSQSREHLSDAAEWIGDERLGAVLRRLSTRKSGKSDR